MSPAVRRDDPPSVSGHPDGHSHDHDHGHFDDGYDGPVEDNPLWLEDNVTLQSVGIDIGSSGTQVVFSRLHLRRLGDALTSRFVVVHRDTLFRSEVALTPYEGSELIDAAALGAVIDAAYHGASLHPRQIDTGAVILTGEALLRRNASRIAHVVADRAGDLVCASAGHHMEALLAAHGAGAVRRSSLDGSRILTVDVGGGTTKLALVDHGEVVATGAVNVGGRLHVFDASGRVAQVAASGARHLHHAGLQWQPGTSPSPEDRTRLAESMADVVVGAVRGAPEPWSALTEPLVVDGGVDGVLFSGGVAEYVYGREDRDFGDMGRPLGAELRARCDRGDIPYRLLDAGECIRATVLGASEYTVQLSGRTSHLPDADRMLPRRNLPVVRPRTPLPDDVHPSAVAEDVERAVRRSGHAPGTFAIALDWAGEPSHRRLAAVARGLVDALHALGASRAPVYLIVDGDVAQSLGRILAEEVGGLGDLLVVDGVRLSDFDYVDIGTVKHPSTTVPVTIKSLVFPDPAHQGKMD